MSSTDVSQITGSSMRSARNMMGYIRRERGLGNQQVISIFDFNALFHFSIPLLYEYINTDLFAKGPIDEDAARRAYRIEILESGTGNFLNHPDLEIFMTALDKKMRQQQRSDLAAAVLEGKDLV
ncbi:hypothetical protein [Bizionia myxarmorum]|uniref:Uncharacterized protein n=1 Tax=Bizionia myxarmorum TaxID=291186 RepID=A0A5D0R7C3_9FLAO|nr:hypothetical protein [Bizionia myxarmorum]TYB76989.1 hypothetical protein ES674_09815 [Bizionia myxarmorum]